MAKVAPEDIRQAHVPAPADALLTVGGQVADYAPDYADQVYPLAYAGLNAETTNVTDAANSNMFVPPPGEFETTLPVSEGVYARIINTPDPSIGGHHGYGNTLTYRTGIRDTRWLEQEFNGQTMSLPISPVNPPGVVGVNPVMHTVIQGSTAALAGDPTQTPLQNMELYSTGLPMGGDDPNYG